MIWTKFAHIILKYRIIILILLLALAGFMAYQIQFLKLDYGYAGLLPDSHPVSRNLQEFTDEFGGDATIVLIGCQDHDFFQLEKFNDWCTLKKNILEVEGVEEVLTISDAYNIRKDTENRKFVLYDLFPEQVSTQAQLDSLKEVFYSLPFYKDLIYSKTSDVYMLAITMNDDIINTKARENIMDSFDELAFEFGSKYELDMHFSGLPYVRTKLAIMIKDELLKFIWLAAGVLAIVLFVFFRSFNAVLFSLLVVFLAVACALGMIVLLDYRITILSGMLPAVIIVIGIPNCVFLLNKYHQEFKLHGNKMKALQRAIHKVGNAIFLTNLTTASGFATFMIIQHRILSRFGQVASVSIIILFVISITLIPIIFSFLPPPKGRQIKHLENKLLHRIVEWFAWAVSHRAKVIYMGVVALMIMAIVGITKMKSTGFIIDDIPQSHPVFMDLKFYEKHIKCIMPLEISVDTRKTNGVLQTKTLRKVEDFQNKLASYPGMARPYSIVDGLKFARQAYFNGAEKQYRLPSSQERNFVLKYLGEQTGQSNLLTSFIDSSKQKLRVSARVADVGTFAMLELQDSILKDLNHFFPPEQYTSMLTGSSLTFTLGTSYLVRNLFWSLGLAILLISIFMAWMFKSARMVFVTVLPNILPLIFTAGLMGFLNIPIKPSTVLVFSVAFGISVDTAIHFLAKYRQEMFRPDIDPRQAVVNSIREVGVSIIYTVIVLFLGFGVFVASKFGGTVSMGILVSITLFVAVFANLLLVPTILLAMNPKTKKKIK